MDYLKELWGPFLQSVSVLQINSIFSNTVFKHSHWISNARELNTMSTNTRHSLIIKLNTNTEEHFHDTLM